MARADAAAATLATAAARVEMVAASAAMGAVAAVAAAREVEETEAVGRAVVTWVAVARLVARAVSWRRGLPSTGPDAIGSRTRMSSGQCNTGDMEGGASTLAALGPMDR